MALQREADPAAVSPWNHARAVLLLPFMNTVVIPAVLLLSFRDARIGDSPFGIELALISAAAALVTGGLTLVTRSIALFIRLGRGTLAPWDPTRVLITDGVYRYSRNPMKAGLFLILIGECCLLRSTALTVWAASFMLANVLYIRWFEEKGLRARFGQPYEDYCRRVPRWLSLRATRAPLPESLERFS